MSISVVNIKKLWFSFIAVIHNELHMKSYKWFITIIIPEYSVQTLELIQIF